MGWGISAETQTLGLVPINHFGRCLIQTVINSVDNSKDRLLLRPLESGTRNSRSSFCTHSGHRARVNTGAGHAECVPPFFSDSFLHSHSSRYRKPLHREYESGAEHMMRTVNVFNAECLKEDPESSSKWTKGTLGIHPKRKPGPE